MTNVSLLGNNGSGKTFLLTYFATKFKRTIFSNYKLKLDNYIPLEIEDLLNMDKFTEGNIFIDEAYTWLESRRSGSALNLLATTFTFQKRKRLLDVYLTEQLFSSIDKRVRELSNIIIECYPRIDFDKDDFNFRYIDVDSNFSFDFTILYEVAKQYFHYYDTYEIQEIPNKNKYEFDVLKKYPKRLLKKIKEIAKVIKPKLNIITHDSIKTALLLDGIEIGYEKYLYIYLKGMINIDNNQN